MYNWRNRHFTRTLHAWDREGTVLSVSGFLLKCTAWLLSLYLISLSLSFTAKWSFLQGLFSSETSKKCFIPETFWKCAMKWRLFQGTSSYAWPLLKGSHVVMLRCRLVTSREAVTWETSSQELLLRRFWASSITLATFQTLSSMAGEFILQEIGSERLNSRLVILQEKKPVQVILRPQAQD